MYAHSGVAAVSIRNHSANSLINTWERSVSPQPHCSHNIHKKLIHKHSWAHCVLPECFFKKERRVDTPRQTDVNLGRIIKGSVSTGQWEVGREGDCAQAGYKVTVLSVRTSLLIKVAPFEYFFPNYNNHMTQGNIMMCEKNGERDYFDM